MAVEPCGFICRRPGGVVCEGTACACAVRGSVPPAPAALHRCPNCKRLFDSPSVCADGTQTVPVAP